LPVPHVICRNPFGGSNASRSIPRCEARRSTLPRGADIHQLHVAQLDRWRAVFGARGVLKASSIFQDEAGDRPGRSRMSVPATFVPCFVAHCGVSWDGVFSTGPRVPRDRRQRLPQLTFPHRQLMLAMSRRPQQGISHLSLFVEGTHSTSYRRDWHRGVGRRLRRTTGMLSARLSDP